MKQFIILAAMIGLGTAIFHLIAGPSDSSILHLLGTVWGNEIEARSTLP